MTKLILNKEASDLQSNISNLFGISCKEIDLIWRYTFITQLLMNYDKTHKVIQLPYIGSMFLQEKDSIDEEGHIENFNPLVSLSPQFKTIAKGDYEKVLSDLTEQILSA